MDCERERGGGAGRRRVRVLVLLSAATATVAAAALGWLAWSALRGHPPPAHGLDPGSPFVRRSGVKYILLWNEFFESFYHGTLEVHCPQSRCFSTRDRSVMPPEEFDAIVFHMIGLKMSLRPEHNRGKFPPKRSPRQRYIFFLLESPVHSRSTYSGMEHLFNWTMTYRLDSDVVVASGVVRPRAGTGVKVPAKGWLQPSATPAPPPLPPDHNSPNDGRWSAGQRQREGGRSRGGEAAVAAWLVSNCVTQSRREKFVARLSEHMEVHVYGGCGTPWPKNDSDGFFTMLSKKYKFYLSFENSLCRDYVTEKLFNILNLKQDVVPVVYGAANYSAVAPPYSYIDARAFETPRHLAEYLHFLARHPDEYAKYFWWKSHYEAILTPFNRLCLLCEKLHEEHRPKSYADMKEWWDHDGVCEQPDVSS